MGRKESGNRKPPIAASQPSSGLASLGIIDAANLEIIKRITVAVSKAPTEAMRPVGAAITQDHKFAFYRARAGKPGRGHSLDRAIVHISLTA